MAEDNLLEKDGAMSPINTHNCWGMGIPVGKEDMGGIPRAIATPEHLYNPQKAIQTAVKFI